MVFNHPFRKAFRITDTVYGGLGVTQDSTVLAVLNIVRELLNHDCQVCREHWDDAREEIVMRLAIAMDRVAV